MCVSERGRDIVCVFGVCVSMRAREREREPRVCMAGVCVCVCGGGGGGGGVGGSAVTAVFQNRLQNAIVRTHSLEYHCPMSLTQ